MAPHAAFGRLQGHCARNVGAGRGRGEEGEREREGGERERGGKQRHTYRERESDREKEREREEGGGDQREGRDTDNLFLPFVSRTQWREHCLNAATIPPSTVHACRRSVPDDSQA